MVILAYNYKDSSHQPLEIETFNSDTTIIKIKDARRVNNPFIVMPKGKVMNDISAHAPSPFGVYILYLIRE